MSLVSALEGVAADDLMEVLLSLSPRLDQITWVLFLRTNLSIMVFSKYIKESRVFPMHSCDAVVTERMHFIQEEKGK